jgi:RING-type zinc-finger
MDDIDCPICFCPYTPKGDHVALSLQCGHSFGKSCLQDYMSASRDAASCPQCALRSIIRGQFEAISPNYTLISCREFLKQARNAARDVRTAGYNANEGRSAGCVSHELDLGASELGTAGCSASEGRSAGCIASEIKIGASELRTAGCSAVN